MARIARDVVASCKICHATKYYAKPTVGEQYYVLPDEPREAVAVDIFGPLPTAQRGYKYVLVVMDKFSKHVRLYPMTNQKLDTIAERMGEYFEQMGVPKEVLTDNGGQFITTRWAEFARENGFQPKKTTPYNPQSNPVERVMRELGRIVRTYASHRQGVWSKIIRRAEDVLNSTIHSSTGFTPNELHFDRTDNFGLREDLLPEIYQEQGLEEKIETARENLKENAAKRKRQADRKLHAKEYEQGERVWVKLHRQSDASRRVTRKIYLVYDGPYRILRVLRKNAYLIGDDEGNVIGAFNARQIRPHRESQFRPDNGQTDSNTEQPDGNGDNREINDPTDQSEIEISDSDRGEETVRLVTRNTADSDQSGSANSETGDPNRASSTSELGEENGSTTTTVSEREPTKGNRRANKRRRRRKMNRISSSSDSGENEPPIYDSETSDARDRDPVLTNNAIVKRENQIVTAETDERVKVINRNEDDSFEHRVETDRGYAYRKGNRYTTRSGTTIHTIEQGYHVNAMVRIPYSGSEEWLTPRISESQKRREKTRSNIARLNKSLGRLERRANQARSSRKNEISDSVVAQAIKFCERLSASESETTPRKTSDQEQYKRTARSSEEANQSSVDSARIASSGSRFDDDQQGQNSEEKEERTIYSDETTAYVPDNQQGNPLIWDVSPIAKIEENDQADQSVIIIESDSETESYREASKIVSKIVAGSSEYLRYTEDNREKNRYLASKSESSVTVIDATTSDESAIKRETGDSTTTTGESVPTRPSEQTQTEIHRDCEEVIAILIEAVHRRTMEYPDFVELLREEREARRTFTQTLRDNNNVEEIQSCIATTKSFTQRFNQRTQPTPSDELQRANEETKEEYTRAIINYNLETHRTSVNDVELNLKRPTGEDLAKLRLLAHTTRHPLTEEDEDIEFHVLLMYKNGTVIAKQFFPTEPNQTLETNAIINIIERTETPKGRKADEAESQRDSASEKNEKIRGQRRKGRNETKKRKRFSTSEEEDSNSEPIKTSRRSRSTQRDPRRKARVLSRNEKKIDGRSSRRPETYIRDKGGKFAPKVKVIEEKIISVAITRIDEPNDGKTEKAATNGKSCEPARVIQPLVDKRAENTDEPQPSTSQQADILEGRPQT
ncbi:uncharacterized protein LOC105840381 [Monomorium pharaonis]|uniref:uncharacterized protein LOC105840381 n=1 Tax=Monomorium pharaonis TaxID=307658 RepID=UPI001746F80D|nr:uncharacterized protein LOC105840381 [Monomorium pharaonis]